MNATIAQMNLNTRQAQLASPDIQDPSSSTSPLAAQSSLSQKSLSQLNVDSLDIINQPEPLAKSTESLENNSKKDASPKNVNTAAASAPNRGSISSIPSPKGSNTDLSPPTEPQNLVNIADKFGQCPLHVAAFHKNVEAVILLMKSKASPNIIDEDGKTPLDAETGTRNMLLEKLTEEPMWMEDRIRLMQDKKKRQAYRIKACMICKEQFGLVQRRVSIYRSSIKSCIDHFAQKSLILS